MVQGVHFKFKTVTESLKTNVHSTEIHWTLLRLTVSSDIKGTHKSMVSCKQDNLVSYCLNIWTKKRPHRRTHCSCHNCLYLTEVSMQMRLLSHLSRCTRCSSPSAARYRAATWLSCYRRVTCSAASWCCHQLRWRKLEQHFFFGLLQQIENLPNSEVNCLSINELNPEFTLSGQNHNYLKKRKKEKRFQLHCKNLWICNSVRTFGMPLLSGNDQSLSLIIATCISVYFCMCLDFDKLQYLTSCQDWKG